MLGYNCNMYYIIDKASLYDLVFEEVSKVADEAYAEDGTSLYDMVILTEKDRSTVERFLDDGVRHLVRVANDITSYAPLAVTDNGVTTITPRLLFFVPDMDATQEDETALQVTRYITLFACAAIFRQRRPSLVEEYTSRVQGALDSAIALLRKRTAPSRT